MKLCKGISSCYCAADFMVHSTLFDGDERNQAADLLNVMRGFLLEETRKVRIYVKIINGCFAAEWETLIVLLNIQTDYEVMYKK